MIQINQDIKHLRNAIRMAENVGAFHLVTKFTKALEKIQTKELHGDVKQQKLFQDNQYDQDEYIKLFLKK